MDIITPNKIVTERKSICENCKHNKIGVCSICLCVIYLKTKLAFSECPIGRWGKYNPAEQANNA